MSTPQGRPDPDDVDARFRAIVDAEFGPTAVARHNQPFNLTDAMDHAAPEPGDDEAWAPATPEPLPRPATRVAAGIVLVAFSLLCFGAELVGLALPSPVGLLAIGCFAGGLAVLLTSLPRHPRDPWDDGSRV